MLNKLFGNRVARRMTVKRGVEMIYAGVFITGFGAMAIGLGSTFNALFGPARTSPSLLESVVISVGGLALCAAFVWLTAWADRRAEERLALAEPSDVQQVRHIGNAPSTS